MFKFNNIFIKENDLVETNYMLNRTTYISQVKVNPFWMADLALWVGAYKVCSLKDKIEDDERFKNSILAVYREKKGAGFVKIWGQTLKEQEA